jgi:hypothetical protein
MPGPAVFQELKKRDPASLATITAVLPSPTGLLRRRLADDPKPKVNTPH